MKKILLGTTTLIGAAALFSGAAFAETPKVTLGGLANFEVGVASDDQDSATNNTAIANDQRPQGFRSQTTVTVRVDGKSDAGLGYGGGMDLQADTSGDANNGGLNARRTFIYLEGSNWGRFEMGSEVGADATMKVDAAGIARATGGIDGDWTFFANNLNGTRYLATPDLPVNYGVSNDVSGFGNEGSENTNKITYYTPRFAGFQLGLSYAPDDVSRGQFVTRFKANTQNGVTGSTLGFCSTAGGTPAAGTTCTESNIFSGGINYDNKFDNVGVTVAATGEAGDSDSALYEDLRAWNAGAKLTYLGFSLAGSYGSWDDSYRLKTDNASGTHYWTVGGAYEYGPFGVSVTYLNSRYDNPLGATVGGSDRFHNLSFGADYKLAPGLTPYVELDFFKSNAPGIVNDNDGTIFLAGTQLAF